MMDYVNYGIVRLPYSDKVRVVAQTNGDVETFCDCEQLTGHNGFVMIPFSVTDDSPVLLVRPDVDVTMPYESVIRGVGACEVRIESGDKETYMSQFNLFHDSVCSDFDKLVLSRCVDGRYRGDETAVFAKACASYPRSMVYMFHSAKEGTWIGATPEILLSGKRPRYNTVALAGTNIYSENLMWSDKNKEEQSLVAQYIRDSLYSYTTDLKENGPYTSRAANLAHLKTDFSFDIMSDIDVVTLVRVLHPTPAVCGLPKEKALAYINRYEHSRRRYYSGVTGVLDVKGETELYVNLRCAHFKDGYVRLYAGGGIMRDSDAESEWNETESKLHTICSVLS